MRFVILSSSRGTTLQAVIDALQEGMLTAECAGLVTDRPDRGCIDKAQAAQLPVRIVEKEEEESREAYDRRLHEAILDLLNNPDAAPQQGNEKFYIAALGWMFIFSPWFIEQWRNRIINVHPALLPQHGGKGMYGSRVHEAVLASGDEQSGITIHLMDEGVDTGPVLLQKTCPVEPDDTPETLKKRVQALEKEWYPKVLQMIHTGEIDVS